MEKLSDPEHPLWSFLPEMTNEFWAAITGAIVGSVIGGLITFGIQRMSLKAAENERVDTAKDRQRSLGYSLLFKMVRIYSGLATMHNHVEECFTRAREQGHGHLEPWAVLLPIANPLDKVHFANEEMAMLLSLKDNNLFNDLVALDSVHNSTIGLFRMYGAERGALLEKLPANMTGLVGRISLPEDQAQHVQPKMAELNALVTDTRKRCKKDYDKSLDVLNRLNNLLNQKLELGVSVVPR
ncbi:hypothetical protein [Marivibrio halodurans]|uniref:hypothetical protein n=1 Tax=Marivibrio halodurans TaxID=2039722 RepID=UPI0036D27761